jgi:hypothetical protein
MMSVYPKMVPGINLGILKHKKKSQGLFDMDGKLKDTHAKRIDKFLGELIWMSHTLQVRTRKHFTLGLS